MMYTFSDLEQDCKTVFDNAGMEDFDGKSSIGKLFEGAKKYIASVIEGHKTPVIQINIAGMNKLLRNNNYATLMEKRVFTPRRMKGSYKDFIPVLYSCKVYMTFVEKESIPDVTKWMALLAAGKVGSTKAPLSKDGYRISMESVIGKALSGRDTEVSTFGAKFSNMNEFEHACRDVDNIFSDFLKGSVAGMDASIQRLSDLVDTLQRSIAEGHLELSKPILRSLSDTVLATARHADMYSVCTTLAITTGNALNNTIAELSK